MEEVYLRKQNPAVSENICFRDFFKQYSLHVLSCQINPMKGRGVIKALLDVDESEYSPLIKMCNPHILCPMRRIQHKCKGTIRGFRPGFRVHTIPENVTELKSLQYLKNRTESEKLALKKSLKYVGEVSLDPGADVIDNFTKQQLVPYDEYVLTVRVYMPWKHRSIEMSKAKMPQVSQEFLIPGSMTLEKLRDRIGCAEDYQDITPDVSESPLEHTATRSGDVYKSALFYIGNIFYIDARYEGNLDYSEVIKKWGVRKKLNMHRTEKMEETFVHSLVCRMGYPYVFMHQGCCEHMMVITDARLLHPCDVRILDDYPVMVSFSALKGKSCDICKTKVAKFIICDSPILTYDTAYLCSSCTFLYNYIGNLKITNFKMYKYTDRLAVL